MKVSVRIEDQCGWLDWIGRSRWVRDLQLIWRTSRWFRVGSELKVKRMLEVWFYLLGESIKFDGTECETLQFILFEETS